MPRHAMLVTNYNGIETRLRWAIDREYGRPTPLTWGPEEPQDINIPKLLNTYESYSKVTYCAIAKTPTRIKKSTQDSSQLPATKKCDIREGQVLEFTLKEEAANDHLKVVLTGCLPTCLNGFWNDSVVYLYKPHFKIIATQN